MPKDFARTASTVATVNGTSTYSLASDVQQIILLRYTTGGADYLIDRVPSQQEFYNKVYGSTVSNNKPRFYFQLGPDTNYYKQIQLFPVPDAAYTINYSYYRIIGATQLTTTNLNSEIPYIPKQYHDAVWKIGLYEFLKGFDDPYQARAKADAQEALAQIEQMQDLDMDDGGSFRFDTTRRDFRGPATGIRIV